MHRRNLLDAIDHYAARYPEEDAGRTAVSWLVERTQQLF